MSRVGVLPGPKPLLRVAQPVPKPSLRDGDPPASGRIPIPRGPSELPAPAGIELHPC